MGTQKRKEHFMFNCLTHALKIEKEANLDTVHVLNWYQPPFLAIEEYCKKYNRTSRELSSLEDEISEDEWRIIFWGFFPSKFNYEGTVEMATYHFILQEEDGSFSERLTYGAEIRKLSKVEMEATSREFLECGAQYTPKYFAVRKTN